MIYFMQVMELGSEGREQPWLSQGTPNIVRRVKSSRANFSRYRRTLRNQGQGKSSSRSCSVTVFRSTNITVTTWPGTGSRCTTSMDMA